MKAKRIVSYILIIALLIVHMKGTYVYANDNIDEGKCGTSMQYVLSSDGTLTISGTGEMTNKNWSTFKDDIKKVIIEDGVKSIASYAFGGCVNLTQAVMSDSVIDIGAYAFDGCTSLKDVELSESITIINKNTFYECTSLDNISVPSKVREIGENCFYNCSSLTSIIIPDSVKKIQNFAFYGCTKLQNIEMSGSIEEVGNDIIAGTAYYDNSLNWENRILYCGNSLIDAYETISGDVEIKEGTRVIADMAFMSSDITSVTFPKTLVGIGKNAFSNCSKLKEVVYNDGLKIIGESAFKSAVLLREANLPDTVEEIGAYAFSSCVRLSKFNSPKNLKKIGQSAFNGCSALEEFTLPYQLISIGDNVFDGCDLLTTLYAYSELYLGDMSSMKAILPTTLTQIYGYKNSNYDTYADKYGIEFIEVDKEEIPLIENEYGKVKVTERNISYISSYEDEQNNKYINYSNIYLNSQVSASASERSAYEAVNVLDGDLNTSWVSATYNSYVIIIDLGQKINFDNMIIWWENGAVEYEVCVSDIGNYYERIMYVTNGEGYRTDEIDFTSIQTGRYIKINALSFQSINSGYKMRDIGVFGLEGQVEDIGNITEPTTADETTTENEITNEDYTTTGVIPTTTNAPTTTDEPAITVPSTTEKLTTDSEITTKNEPTTDVPETTVNSLITNNTSYDGPDKNVVITSKADIDKELKKISIKKINEKNYHTSVIEWKKVDKNCIYEVYRATKKKGKYIKIATVSKTKYQDKKVKPGKKYYYKVKAILDGNFKTSKIKMIKIKGAPKKPTMNVSIGGELLKIKWGMITDNSNGIEIFVKSKQGGYNKYTLINETTNLKKKKKKKGVTGIESPIAGLKKDAVYNFKVRTYAIVKGKKVYSKWSKVKKIRIK